VDKTPNADVWRVTKPVTFTVIVLKSEDEDPKQKRSQGAWYMPIFRNRTVFEIAQNLKAFVNLEAGIVRGNVPGFGPQRIRSQKTQQVPVTKKASPKKVDPAKLVWIFGTGRSGSTWLMRMMADMPGAAPWDEPKVGRLFGEFYEKANPGELSSRNFIMGDPAREGWILLIRQFVLGSIGYLRPKFGPENYLIIKEPNASVGASLLMEALPESRMIMLIRDPRDAAASTIDAMQDGGWLHQRRSREGRKTKFSGLSPEEAAKRRANTYVRDINNARKAFDAHNGYKVLVRYEELRADTLNTMKRIYSELGIEVDERKLARVVEKHAFENVPEDQKGPGKFIRKATPGGWKEDLAPEQVEVIEKITAPLIKEYYPG
jgi:LPS sulfotransferase NodH